MKSMILLVFSALYILSGIALAGDFPVVGATYQLDRAKYPGKVAVCSTEDAMVKYMEAQQAGDKGTMSKMLFKVSTFDDIGKMKKAGGCTLISSYSQAKVVKKGIEAHQAQFFAFLLPMWGYYEYFGGRVK